MIGDMVPSLIRTVVPVMVGAVIAWLATVGIDLDDTAQASAVAFLTALFSALYYALIRVLEKKWPQIGFFLGMAVQPQYGNVAAVKDEQGGYKAEEYSPYPEGTPVEILPEDTPAQHDTPVVPMDRDDNNNKPV